MNDPLPVSALPEPVTDDARKVRDEVSRERWARLVEEAQEKADIVRKVRQMEKRSGRSRRKCLQRVAKDVGWSCFEHWRRRWEKGTGPGWERLIDRRLPPRPPEVSSAVRVAAVTLRMAIPTIGSRETREKLEAQFGEAGRISVSTLGKIWREAGLTAPGDPVAGTPAVELEDVKTYHGGAAFAILAAAEAEVGVIGELATEALRVGRETALAQQPPALEVTTPHGRDERGCFTADYNKNVRSGVPLGKTDFRWEPHHLKQARCDLSQLQLLSLSSETIAHRMLAMALLPFLTERRGFDGLDGPKGDLLEVVLPTPYMAATLDKTLSELALLGVGESLWVKYGSICARLDRVWGGDGLKWIIIYVDGTADPYWTANYALSGKVSRVGRVMPCLSRIAVMGGCGIPLLVALSAGAQSLQKSLTNMLDEADRVLGDDQVTRFTVVDAEAAKVVLLAEMATRKSHDFVTVLKGRSFNRTKLEQPGDWEMLGDRERIRSGWVTLRGAGAPEDGLRLRVVERERVESRNPHRTLFATTADESKLDNAGVVAMYLSRWPRQEQFFRNERNGGGGDRSHGFGGEYVTHVAQDTKLDEAQRRLDSAQKKLEVARTTAHSAELLHKTAQEAKADTSASKLALKLARKEERSCERALAAAQGAKSKLDTMPREIYKRDTTREWIVSALTTAVLLLTEYSLREFFGGLRIEFRTFIEHFVHTATTVRSDCDRVLYQFEANARSPVMSAKLRYACAELNRRKIRRVGRLLEFEVVEKPGQSP